MFYIIQSQENEVCMLKIRICCYATREFFKQHDNSPRNVTDLEKDDENYCHPNQSSSFVLPTPVV